MPLPSPCVAEIDSKPTYLHESARDWTELAVTRLLVTPLFVEAEGRSTTSKLIDTCERLTDLSWRIAVSSSARWSDGSPLRSDEIAAQIHNARTAKAAPLVPALTIDRMQVLSSTELLVHTRFPIAHLDRVLANPGLAPHDQLSQRSTNRYVLKEALPTSMVLRCVGRGSDIDLTWNASDAAPIGRRNRAHIKGPTVFTSAGDFLPNEPTPTQVVPLDLLFCLFLPQWISHDDLVQIHNHLDRSCLGDVTQNAVIPRWRMTATWDSEPSIHRISAAKTLEIGGRQRPHILYYANFPANREVATYVSAALTALCGINVTQTLCDYEQIISKAIFPFFDAFFVSPVAAPWPHPASLLSPFYFGKRSSSTFESLFLKSLSRPDLESAIHFAKQAENVLVSAGSRVLPLGQIRGTLSSQIGLPYFPPSGWVDYSEVTTDRN